MPRTSLRITIGKGLSEEGILEALRQNNPELLNALLGDLSIYDLRATYSNDSLDLKSVSKGSSPSRYLLSYSFGWEAYYGCRDRSGTGVVPAEIDFTYRGGDVIFVRTTVEQRDTHEEF